jgi:cytochrome oxidase Cu insertion factor (SCO1/SenC/PrrC family)
VKRRLALVLLAALALAAAEPRFAVPAPGSYELPPILEVGEHRLLDEQGRETPLLGIAAGEAALVSFVYLGCADACPLATAVLQQVDRRVSERPELAGRVVLVTVSFDPERDRPEQMGRLARSLAPRGRWRFLTAKDAVTLAPVLEDFGQDALALPAPNTPADRYSHVMKVFLVDGEGRVRNVYSAGFLDARVLVNDLLTVLAEPQAPRP